MNSKLENIEATLWICVLLLAGGFGVSGMHLLNEHAVFVEALSSAPANAMIQSGSTQTLAHIAIVACTTTAMVFVAKAAAKLRRFRKENLTTQALPHTA